MRKIVLFSALCLFSFAIPTTSAHVLKTDGHVGVLLHVDPDDDPFVGQPATLLFSVTDTTKSFQASDCDCQVSISVHGQNLSSQSATVLDDSTLDASFDFPAKDVYQVTFSGKPTGQASFQSFQMSYDVRVDRLSKTESKPPKTAVIIASIVGVMVLITTGVLLAHRKAKL